MTSELGESQLSDEREVGNWKKAVIIYTQINVPSGTNYVDNYCFK